MLQIETVDSTNGIPARSAARAACTSARGANMPPSPTGARITGNASCCPSTSTRGSRTLTSRITTWRNRISSRSATFASIVASS
jgi:hypothetical protein